MEDDAETNQSFVLDKIVNTTNPKLKIDFDYQKFMKEIKASHSKLSKLNEALKKKKTLLSTVVAGNCCLY